jgi:hypothetical protein
MAREIVITSVPRGVRPGRTGFQIAMRTAGLREDVCDQLEGLGVYRHLPPGVGPNPVCYFHKLVQTGIGPLQVLGRVLDAGADYSSRSNKLAHLVAIEAAELAGLRQSSPAAVLSAIEPRLARTWPGGPEERQRPFDLAGMPTEAPRICIGWQQAVGDAGWGGVLAEQAVKNKPVLVIAPDSSPEWCRRLLALFAEALALVPPARRWNVTFDTTILSVAPVTWRGTYAGSPESGSRQPGLLVVDLRGRPAVPEEMAGLPLVQQARAGVTAAPTAVLRPGPKPPVEPPPIDDDGPILIPGKAPGVPNAPPPPFPRGHHEYETPNHWQAWIAWGVIALLVLIAVPIGVFFWAGGWKRVERHLAKQTITAWAARSDGNEPNGQSKLTHETWLAAYGQQTANQPTGLDTNKLTSILELLNSSLLTAEITPESIKGVDEVNKLISKLEALRSGNVQVADFKAVGVMLPQGDDAFTARIVGWVNEVIRARGADGVNDVDVVRVWLDELRPLADLAAPPGNDVPRPDPQEVKAALAVVFKEPNAPNPITPEKLDAFAQQVIANRALVANATSLDDLRKKLASPAAATGSPAQSDAALQQKQERMGENGQSLAEASKGGEQEKQDETKAPLEEKQKKDPDKDWQAFRARVQQASNQPRPWPEPNTPVPLVTGIPPGDRLDWTKLDLVLASAGSWKPRAEREQDGEGQPSWRLRGLPKDNEALWGTIRLEPAVAEGRKQLVFIAKGDAPWVCGYVPIHFSHPDVEGSSDPPIRPLRIATKPQSLSWKVTGPVSWAELAGFTAEGETTADEATLGLDDQVLGLCAPRLKPQVVGKVGNLLVEQVPPQGSPNVMIVTYSSPGSQDSLNVVARFTSEARPLGVTFKPELTTSWDRLVHHDFKGIDWKILADPKKPVWILDWQRVVLGWSEIMLLKAGVQENNRWGPAEVNKRNGTRSIGGDLEVQYAPWGPIAPNTNSQKLHEWKKMAVDYVVKKGRHFRVKASNQEDDALRKAAENPADVQEFLARETQWRAGVEATFADDVQSKADQNELLALLVLAYLDGVVAIKSDPDSVRNAFGKKIADSVKAEVWIDWTFDGRPGLEEVQVAKVVGAAADELNKK